MPTACLCAHWWVRCSLKQEDCPMSMMALEHPQHTTFFTVARVGSRCASATTGIERALAPHL